MYRLATKCTTKKRSEKVTEMPVSMWIQATRVHGSRKVTARLSTMTRCRLQPVRTADCRRRSAVIVGSSDWQRTDFLFRGRDVAITINNVKILHAVRSAITAIAELLVLFYFTLESHKLWHSTPYMVAYTEKIYRPIALSLFIAWIS